MKIIGVVVNRMALGVDKIYHYTVGDADFSRLKVGSLISIPFGRGDTPTEGFVLELPAVSEVDNLKEILGIIDEKPQFNEELLSVSRFMRERYLCTLINALKLVVSPGSKINASAVGDKTVAGASLNIETDEAFAALDRLRTKAPKQARIVELMLQNDFVAYEDIKMLVGCGREAIRSLEKKGVLRPAEVAVFRNPVDFSRIKSEKPKKPTEEQAAAIDKITSSLGENRTFLLHGITGSGKTEVFLQCIQRALSMGKSALVLVPEISLTPQMVERFASRFGRRIAVLHSKLSYGERSDEYKRISSGEADVVIGVRSAVFAPLVKPGIIILDEEHETTYKSERIPCYHAREVAEYRARLGGYPLLLASATPSIESYYKAKSGEYELIELKRRINNCLPEVEIVDMCRELTDGNRSVFSERLKNAIAENRKKGEQTILFLNRRGFSTFVSCRSCGYVMRCRHCNISLNYHKDKEYLTCHYCGYTVKNVRKCPECGSAYIRHFGTGTQKIEEEIKELFPGISVLRMDVDTTGRKASHEKILRQFEEEKTDVLIGTQMVTKGLDFPNVTLVGVLAADMSLNMDDFRANERSFSLITQVCGRAGRGDKSGRAVVQTYMPNNRVLELAASQDYPSFYDEEISLRRALNYPPYCDLVSVLIASVSNSQAAELAKKTAELISGGAGEDCELLGPAPALISRINGKYRWRVTVKCRLDDAKRELFREIAEKHQRSKLKKLVSLAIEINPTGMF